MKKQAGIEPNADGTDAHAWYLPSGNPCIDYCRCVHETTHLKQVRAGKWDRLPNECGAHKEQQSCLEGCK
jgi:hypothetical protein